MLEYDGTSWHTTLALGDGELLYVTKQGTGTWLVDSRKRVLASSRRAFVTSTTYQGNFGGVSKADSSCRAQAYNAGLGSNFAVWMSDSGSTADNRLRHWQGYYVTVDYSEPIAFKWDDLIDGNLANGIENDETGVTRSGAYVWTGDRQGGLFGTNCNDWTSNTMGSPGTYGVTGRTDDDWATQTLRRSRKRTRVRSKKRTRVRIMI